MANMLEHKKVLEKLAQLIGMEQECAAIISPENITWREDLAETKKKTGEEFIVLIMGIFSSGKSSMINALIGEDLLPTGFLPETAVIGEMRYSENRKITLYPKKGKWEGGDKPFELINPSSEEISKYASIDNEAGMNSKEDDSDRIESKFEKMVIHWPLEILKDGVVLVDSPGINDPYNNDYITRSYLPMADAIIYVMNSTQAYTGKDKEQLNEINSLGLRNIIFGYTWFDQVEMGSTPAKLEQLKKVLSNHAMNHGDLGVNSVHFLSSLAGLKAKMDQDQTLLIRSGYDGLEKYLAKYLVENKGRDQVRVMSNAIRNYAGAMIKEVKILNKVASGDSAELEKRIAGARKQLEIVKMNSETTEKTFRLSMKNCLPILRKKVEEYMSGLVNKVDLEDFEPKADLAKGLIKFNPIETKKKAKEYQNECTQEFKRRMRNVQNKWIVNELSPNMIELEQDCIEAVQPNLIEISRQLDDVDMILAEGTIKGGSDTATSVAIGFGYSVLTGDWYTGGMASIYGKGTLVKRLAIQSSIGLATGALISTGVIVTMPMFLAAVIIGDIINILSTNTEKQKAKIKKSVVTHSREGFVSDKENLQKNIDRIMENVEAHINKVCEEMARALNNDINQKESLIRATIIESERARYIKEEMINKRSQAVETLTEVVRQTEQICLDYGITE